MNWKFWKKDKPEEIQAPTYSVDPGMYGRLRHMATHGAHPLNLVGKTPEEQAAEFNSTTAAEIFFETKGVTVTADDIRKALEIQGG